MANTSATGGVLIPTPPGPVDDAALDAVLQALVTGLTAIDGSLVRPRWQPTMPKQPASTVNWCALSVQAEDANDGPSITHQPGIDGSDTYIRHESLMAFMSFYGPGAQGLAAQFRDGLGIPQNTESLLAYDMRYVACGAIRAVPELVNQTWIRRYDLVATFRRKVTRVYSVLNLLGSTIDLTDDTTINDTILVPPA